MDIKVNTMDILTVTSGKRKGHPAVYDHSGKKTNLCSKSPIINLQDLRNAIENGADKAFDFEFPFWKEKKNERNEGNGFITDVLSSFTLSFYRRFFSIHHESRCLDIILGSLVFILAVCISMIVTLCPQHNGIIHPEYWYEPILPMTLGYIMIVSASNITECYLVMKVDLILTWKSFFKLFIVTASTCFIPYVVIYIVWVYKLGYRHPMPFIGQSSALIQSILRPVVFWFIFPPHLRIDDKVFRKTLLGFTSLFPLRFIMAIVYGRIASTITALPNNMQWCVAILLPLVKKINIWWTTKIGYKAAGCTDQSAQLSMKSLKNDFQVNIRSTFMTR